MLQDIKVVEVVEQPVLSIREAALMSSIPEKMGEIFSEIYAFIQKKELAPVGPPFAYWHGMTGSSVDMECGFPVSESVKGEGRIKGSKLPGGRVATAIHLGPYDKLSEAYKAVESWIRDNGYQTAGNSWEVYLSMPDEEPSKIKTQIFWPVK